MPIPIVDDDDDDDDDDDSISPYIIIYQPGVLNTAAWSHVNM